MPTIEVLPDAAALVQRSLTLVLTRIHAAIEQRGQCTLALAGGNTPKPLYEAIARQNLPWDKLQIFWGDERYVPADHPDSNQRMARQAWLDQVPISPANIHPMPTDAGDPTVDARRYEEHLRDFFHLQGAEDWPSLDLILLGIGPDAHTASLFPQTAALQVRDRLVTAGRKDGGPRLTLTVPLINQARCVLFLVAGVNKQEALTQIFATEADEMAYPARLIQPQGEVIWLLDEAAGQQFRESTTHTTA